MFSDIDEARAQHAALKALVERHGCAARDFRALRGVLDLCRRAGAAVDDRYCRDKLRLIEDFAAEMFAARESRALFLKQHVMSALELFHSRLYSLECARRAAARMSLSAAPLRT